MEHNSNNSNNSKKENNQLIRLGALWENRSKKNVKYYSGKIGNSDIIVFRNFDKEEDDKKPDYQIFLKVKYDDYNKSNANADSNNANANDVVNEDYDEEPVPF